MPFFTLSQARSRRCLPSAPRVSISLIRSRLAWTEFRETSSRCSARLNCGGRRRSRTSAQNRSFTMRSSTAPSRRQEHHTSPTKPYGVTNLLPTDPYRPLPNLTARGLNNSGKPLFTRLSWYFENRERCLKSVGLLPCGQVCSKSVLLTPLAKSLIRQIS